MEEKMEQQNEISLMDIIRLLFSKIKLLILVVVLSGAVGVGTGILLNINEKYYGASVEYYVNPISEREDTYNAQSEYAIYGSYGSHVMDAMTKLLSSESFTERLLLEKNGLPDKLKYPGLDATEYAKAEKLIENAEQAAKELKDMSANDEGYEAARQQAEALQAQAKEQAEIVLEQWKETEQYKEDILFYSEIVSYSYYKPGESADDNNHARSFIYITIKVLNDEQAAEDALEKIKNHVPDYVEKKMFVPSGYTGTICTKITRTDNITLLNPNQILRQAIKYGMIMAFFGGMITAAIVIVLDRIKQVKKLAQDPEEVLKAMNVPVLEAIPVSEEEQKQEKQSKEAKKQTKK